MDVYCNRTHGAYVQTKGSSIVFNFGDADPEFGKMQGKELQNTLGSVLAAFPVVVRTGKGYVEACHQVPPRLTACTLHPPPATRLPPPATRRPPLASRHQPPPRATAPTPATACTAAALHHAGGKAAAFCINIAHVFAAWPPSDRSLGATLRALSGTGSISPLLVFCRRRRGAAVRRALVSHVQRARAKQLKGTSLDALARLLELDEAHASDGSDDEAPEDSGENGDGALGVINGEAGGDGDGTDGAAAGATGQEQRKGEGGEDGTLARAKAALVKCGAADRT